MPLSSRTRCRALEPPDRTAAVSSACRSRSCAPRSARPVRRISTETRCRVCHALSRLSAHDGHADDTCPSRTGRPIAAADRACRIVRRGGAKHRGGFGWSVIRSLLNAAGADPLGRQARAPVMRGAPGGAGCPVLSLARAREGGKWEEEEEILISSRARKGHLRQMELGFQPVAFVLDVLLIICTSPH